MRDEVISMGVIPAVADWKSVNPNLESEQRSQPPSLVSYLTKGVHPSFGEGVPPLFMYRINLYLLP